MDWIFDNFQIVILVGLALASWLKRRADQKAAEREEQEARRDFTEEEYSTGENDGYEEEWQPPSAPSVPPPIMRQEPPPLVRDVSPPPLYVRPDERAAVLKRQREISDAFQKIKSAKAVTSGGAAATRERRNAAQSLSTRQAAAAQSGIPGLSKVLRNRSELRRAVVLREILGPPVGLP
jgi:hypothetical protein